WERAGQGFKHERVRQRGRRLALSSLVCMGRRTVTGLVAAGGRQFEDWSADYRVFSKRRFDTDAVFEAVREGVLDELPDDAPLVAAMDDTIVRKSGPKAHGVAYRRDPLGPPFQVNFVRGQRFIQLSAAVPHGHGPGPARMIPVDFRHAPTPKKPRKNSTPQAWSDYRFAQSKMRLGKVGAKCIKDLRANMDQNLKQRGRPLWMVVDGSFTNREVLKNLPERATLIGRIRKDAKLSRAPRLRAATGRRRLYGADAPTPDELRRDESVPWQKVKAFATGKLHNFKVKVMRDLRWRVAGGEKKLM
ncbi:MAG: transposase, partial [bacterium]|nr:transposase [bacterium]